MNGENGPPKLPEIDTPVLKQEQKEAQRNSKPLMPDEDACSYAIQIVTSWQSAALNRQNSICNDLQRANETLNNLTAELDQKQRLLASINENINELLIALNKSQAHIQELHGVMNELTSPNTVATKEFIQKVIDRYEENRRSSINNSVNKIIDYDKYN